MRGADESTRGVGRGGRGAPAARGGGEGLPPERSLAGAGRLPIGGEVPRRGNVLSRAAARAAMRLRRWRFAGEFPDLPKAVLVVAPHTSNWDFIVGALAMLGLGLRITWLAKHTIFRWPLGPVLRFLGGVAVRRGESSGTVAQVVALFERHDRLLLALAPEGTRRAVPRWHRGFSLIAAAAKVPVIPVGFDWRRRLVIFGPPTCLSGEPEEDEARLRPWFADIAPRRPAGAGRLIPEDPQSGGQSTTLKR